MSKLSSKVVEVGGRVNRSCSLGCRLSRGRSYLVCIVSHQCIVVWNK